MRAFTGTLRLATLALVLPLATGCMAAAAAGGAAGAIAYGERNASADVTASVTALTQATEAVFGEMGIAIQHRTVSENGTEVDIHGRSDEEDVAVNIENEGGATTKVTVTAKEGEVNYKPTVAGRILERIIARAS